MSAFEASVGLMSRSMELKDLKARDKEIDSIGLRNMMRECREFMTKEERDKWGEDCMNFTSKTSRTKRLRMAVHNLF